MPVVRPVTLIAIVTLTMGLALAVSGGAQPNNAAAAPESGATTKAPADPFGHGRASRSGPMAPSGRRSCGSARAIAGVAIRS